MVVEHRGAVEYELMTRTVYTLDDLGGRLTWPALYSFIRYLPPGSALCEDEALRAWYAGAYNATLLANIVDMMRGVGRKGSHVKPLPRPTDRYTKDKKTRHVGADPIPADKFAAWWDMKG